MAVGFEFATGWQIYRLRNNASIDDVRSDADLPNCTELFPKAAVLRGGMDWSLTVDGTEIEYVVKEVAESEAGANHLVFVMADLERFVRMMNNRKKTIMSAADFPAGTFPVQNSRFVIYIPNRILNKTVDAVPQVTSGIRLRRVLTLFSVLGNRDSRAAKQLLTQGGNAPYYSNVVRHVTLDWNGVRDSNWPTHVPSGKLRGLVTLIATYLARGFSPNRNLQGAVKYVFMLMSRTSFSKLFDTLPHEERNHYRGAPGDWVQFICREVMSKVPVPGMPANGLDPNGLVIEQRITDRSQLDQPVDIPITRRDWLRGMLEGTDLLSAEAHPLGGADNDIWEDSNRELGHRLRGLAGLGEKMDTIHYHNHASKGAIIEFRAAQEKLPFSRWGDYALRMHRFFTDINEGDRHGMIDLAAPDLA